LTRNSSSIVLSLNFDFWRVFDMFKRKVTLDEWSVLIAGVAILIVTTLKIPILW